MYFIRNRLVSPPLTLLWTAKIKVSSPQIMYHFCTFQSFSEREILYGYNHIRPHQALNMRPPVPETLLKNGTTFKGWTLKKHLPRHKGCHIHHKYHISAGRYDKYDTYRAISLCSFFTKKPNLMNHNSAQA